jgi:hypothetical protein
MACEEEHIEIAGVEESDSDDSEHEDVGEQESDPENEDVDTDNEADEGGIVLQNDQDNEDTDESEGEKDGETDRDYREAEITEIGETVWCGKEDDPGRQCWRRVECLKEDVRTEDIQETRFKNIRINDQTTELDIFWTLMPLKAEDLLQIIRDGADDANDKRKWDVDHVHAALCVIFGGAQFK